MNRLSGLFLGMAIVSGGLAWAQLPPPGMPAAPPMAPMPLPGGGAMPSPVMAADVPGPEAAGVARASAADAVLPTGMRRDPFWPVGYVPKIAVPEAPAAKGGGVAKPSDLDAAPAPVAEPDWTGARRKLDIRGVSLIGRDKETGKARYFAVVAGKLVESGNVVAVTHEDRVYRWKVVDIRSEGVSLSKLDVKP